MDSLSHGSEVAMTWQPVTFYPKITCRTPVQSQSGIPTSSSFAAFDPMQYTIEFHNKLAEAPHLSTQTDLLLEGA